MKRFAGVPPACRGDSDADTALPVPGVTDDDPRPLAHGLIFAVSYETRRRFRRFFEDEEPSPGESFASWGCCRDPRPGAPAPAAAPACSNRAGR